MQTYLFVYLHIKKSNKMESLYKITQSELELFNMIEENDGELTPEMEEALKLNSDNFEAKARGYIWHIKELESDIVTIDEEKARLDRIKKRNEKMIERLKENMKNALLVFGDKQKIDTFTLSLRANKSVEIIDETAIPHKFKNVKTVETINKTEIKKAIESGLTVPGATIKENQNLQIK